MKAKNIDLEIKEHCLWFLKLGKFVVLLTPILFVTGMIFVWFMEWFIN